MSDGVSLTIKALLAQSAVTAITSTRISPKEHLPGTALPVIVVDSRGESDELTLSGAARYPETSVLIFCVADADTARQALQLEAAVKTALRDHLYTTDSPPTVYASFSQDGVAYSETAPGTFTRVVGFTVRWR